MTSKGRKPHHPVESTAESVEEDIPDTGELHKSMRTVLSMYMDGQSRAEESRKADWEEMERREEARMAREEARIIAAEERAEKRRIADKIAEEERAEARAEAKARRKLEEMKVAEEAERAREEAARLASERLREQQEADSKKAYDQQVELIRMQASIGERAAETHRQEALATRKRDRAVSGIANLKDNEDIEDFLLTSERKLRVGDVPEGEWQAIIAAKLSGKVGTIWQELCSAGGEYPDVKADVLKVCGYTPKLAGEVYYGFRAEYLRGLSADQLYHRGTQLLRRMLGPCKISPQAEFAILKPWVWSLVPKRARGVLDSRVISTSSVVLGG